MNKNLLFFLLLREIRWFGGLCAFLLSSITSTLAQTRQLPEFALDDTKFSVVDGGKIKAVSPKIILEKTQVKSLRDLIEKLGGSDTIALTTALNPSLLDPNAVYPRDVDIPRIEGPDELLELLDSEGELKIDLFYNLKKTIAWSANIALEESKSFDEELSQERLRELQVSLSLVKDAAERQTLPGDHNTLVSILGEIQALVDLSPKYRKATVDPDSATKAITGIGESLSFRITSIDMGSPFRNVDVHVSLVDSDQKQIKGKRIQFLSSALHSLSRFDSAQAFPILTGPTSHSIPQGIYVFWATDGNFDQTVIGITPPLKVRHKGKEPFKVEISIGK